VLRRLEDLAMILVGEVRAKQPDGGQRERSLLEPSEDDREPLRRSRRLDPVIRRMLGKMQSLRAEDEERREALGQVKASLIELGQ
jgi:hypothetical protein